MNIRNKYIAKIDVKEQPLKSNKNNKKDGGANLYLTNLRKFLWGHYNNANITMRKKIYIF